MSGGAWNVIFMKDALSSSTADQRSQSRNFLEPRPVRVGYGERPSDQGRGM